MRTVGSDALTALMNRLQLSVRDISPTFPEMEREFRVIEERQFSSEGSHGGSGGWSPLSDPYRRWKERHYPGKTILRRTDRLYNSLVFATNDSFVEKSRNRLVIGTSIPYAQFHQFGTGRMFRPPISPSLRDVARFQAILHRYFNAAVMKSGQSRVSVNQALVGF